MKLQNRARLVNLLLVAVSCLMLSFGVWGQSEDQNQESDLAGGSFQSSTTFTSLYSFYGLGDGYEPVTSVLLNKYGAIYGTSLWGGAACCGTVFVESGIYHITVHSFGAAPDGALPMGNLVMDSSGNIYGTTYYGGTGSCQAGYWYGCGTVFKLDQKSGYSILYSFTDTGGDGAYPGGDLVIDASGNIYGTTTAGGDLHCNNRGGCGTVFKLTPSNKEEVLYTFEGSPDGSYPVGHLTRDSSGNLYGATLNGGNSSCQCGTVFRIDQLNNERVIYAFKGSHDGAFPFGGVIRDSFGRLYGTTKYGGASNNGTVFAVSSGRESVLYSFTNGSDGGQPGAGLHLDHSHNLYGTTILGGYGYGTIFRIDSQNHMSVLHRFDNSDGAAPLSGLVQDAAGSLYGTTAGGGSSMDGTIFKLTP